MRILFKRLILIGFLVVLASSLSGCFLQLALGRVVTESIGENIRVQIAAIFSRATVAACLDLGEDFFECTFFIDGIEVASTFSLRTELGFFGILVDPVILQVPEDATNFEGTFDDGTGPRPLVITETDSFEVQPGVQVFAESGHKFVILEFPSDVPPTLPSGDPTNSAPFDFELTFDRPTLISDPIEPITVKAMHTGKVIIDGQTFYIPLLPCVKDFGLLPEIEIPESSNMEDLEPVLGDLIRGTGNVGCDGQVYDFTALSPGPVEIDIDIKPGSDPNSIACDNESETIAVAVLTTGDFDATTVDHTTVTFEGASETHVDRKTGEPRRHEEDADEDGDLDMVFHFRLGDTGLECDSIEGGLTGETFDGQTIQGADSLNMVDPGDGQP